MLFHTNLSGSSTLLTTHTAAREWLHEKDANRLDIDQVDRPNTKWVFQRWVQVEVKAILVKQPLLGQGRLPDWLRNKKRSVCTRHIRRQYVHLSLHCSAPWGEARPMYRKGCRTGETIRWCQRPAGTALRLILTKLKDIVQQTTSHSKTCTCQSQFL